MSVVLLWLQQLGTSKCVQHGCEPHGCVFVHRGQVHVVEGEVLPIYHAGLFDPCIMESPAPSQAHLAPKHNEVLSVLQLASC